MDKKILLKLGLTNVQAEIFDCLLQNGPLKASDIARKTKRPRGVTYKGLEELIDLGLISKKESKSSVTLFIVEHPANLEKVLEYREKELNKTKREFTASLPDLISSYNLINNKPGVKFYEGQDGFRRVLEDTLTSKTEICLLLDKSALQKEEEFRKINSWYKNRREQLGIPKRIIRIGADPFHEPNSNLDYKKITNIRYLNKHLVQFKSAIQIYDNKVSFQVINKEHLVSIIIENKNIYEINKFIFNSLWNEAGEKKTSSSAS